MAHPDLDALLNQVLPFAQQMLAKKGDLQPFGGVMKLNGEVALTAVQEPANPDTAAAVDSLTSGFKELARQKTVRAVAVCFDSMATPPGGSLKVDAICVQLEHVSGENAIVFLPYEKGWFGRIKYRSLFASKSESKIFPSQF